MVKVKVRRDQYMPQFQGDFQKNIDVNHPVNTTPVIIVKATDRDRVVSKIHICFVCCSLYLFISATFSVANGLTNAITGSLLQANVLMIFFNDLFLYDFYLMLMIQYYF